MGGDNRRVWLGYTSWWFGTLSALLLGGCLGVERWTTFALVVYGQALGAWFLYVSRSSAPRADSGGEKEG